MTEITKETLETVAKREWYAGKSEFAEWLHDHSSDADAYLKAGVVAWNPPMLDDKTIYLEGDYHEGFVLDEMSEIKSDAFMRVPGRTHGRAIVWEGSLLLGDETTEQVPAVETKTYDEIFPPCDEPSTEGDDFGSW
jgi:hypothetical protein